MKTSDKVNSSQKHFSKVVVDVYQIGKNEIDLDIIELRGCFAKYEENISDVIQGTRNIHWS